MCRILIFGGTSEGRILARFCAENHIYAYISVTTEYGAELLGKSEFLKILTGKMETAAIREFIISHDIETIIDATHPYAEEVTKNIKNACAALPVNCFRIIREQEKIVEGAKYFDDIPHIVSYLDSVSGNILITTGSKNLKEFCGIKDYGKRCAARVLPSPEIIEKCVETGLDRSRIIAQKGPFTAEQNEMHIQRYDIRFLVTKDSGSAGGFKEKTDAANKNNAEILILKRPDEQGVSLGTMKKILGENHEKTS